jgi:hypothetical protein
VIRQNLAEQISQKVNRLGSEMLRTHLGQQIEMLSTLNIASETSTQPNIADIREVLATIRFTPHIPLDIRQNLELQLKEICDLHDLLNPKIDKQFSPYVAQGGQSILVNPESDGQKPWISSFKNMITEATGIHAIPSQQLGKPEKEAIFKEWIKVASAVEDNNRSEYGTLRTQIIASEMSRLNGAPSGLSKVLDKQAAVCRELSILGSTIFAEFGIHSRIGTGSVFTETQSPGRHAWIETLNKQGKIEYIIDTNNSRSIYDSMDSFARKLQGVDYREDGNGQQTVVNYVVKSLYQTASLNMPTPH